jgi:hypothetical protein
MANYNSRQMPDTSNREIVEKFFQAVNALDWDRSPQGDGLTVPAQL